MNSTLEHRLAVLPELANRVFRLLYPKMNRGASSLRISTAN
jgi:hypothetical protein